MLKREILQYDVAATLCTTILCTEIKLNMQYLMEEYILNAVQDQQVTYMITCHT